MTDLFQTGLGYLHWQSVALSLLLAVLLGKLVSSTYERTHRGLSFSRNFAQALVLGALVSSMLIMAIGDNLARGLGILGTMALVRFRTNVPEVRDMIFIFAALAAGVASGAQSFLVAGMGTLSFCFAAYFLNSEPSRQNQRFDGVLRFSLARDSPFREKSEAILQDCCRTLALIAIRELAQGELVEYAYQFKLKRRCSQQELVAAITEIEGARGISVLIEDAHTEI